MSTRIELTNFPNMKSSSSDSSLLCGPPPCTTKSLILTMLSESVLRRTTDFLSSPMKNSATFQLVTSSETAFLPRGTFNKHVRPLVDPSPYAMPAGAPETLANTTMFAPHASPDILCRSAEDASELSPPSEEQHRWEWPKWARGFICAENTASHTPSASSTELADPFPTVPDSVLHDKAAVQTIADHLSLFRIVTPINVDRFETLLISHPNQRLVRSVCKSLQEGVWPYTALDESAPVTVDFSK
jgi:hypothetical protein